MGLVDLPLFLACAFEVLFLGFMHLEFRAPNNKPLSRIWAYVVGLGTFVLALLLLQGWRAYHADWMVFYPHLVIDMLALVVAAALPTQVLRWKHGDPDRESASEEPNDDLFERLVRQAQKDAQAHGN